MTRCRADAPRDRVTRPRARVTKVRRPCRDGVELAAAFVGREARGTRGYSPGPAPHRRRRHMKGPFRRIRFRRRPSPEAPQETQATVVAPPEAGATTQPLPAGVTPQDVAPI